MTVIEGSHEETMPDARPSAKDSVLLWLRQHTTQVNWFVSLVAAGLMFWAAVEWWTRAVDLTAPCAAVGLSSSLCGEVPEYLQRFQFGMAVVGIVTAVSSAVLSVVQAFLGRTLQVMRYAVGLLLACGVIWVAAYWMGRIFYL